MSNAGLNDVIVRCKYPQIIEIFETTLMEIWCTHVIWYAPLWSQIPRHRKRTGICDRNGVFTDPVFIRDRSFSVNKSRVIQLTEHTHLFCVCLHLSLRFLKNPTICEVALCRVPVLWFEVVHYEIWNRCVNPKCPFWLKTSRFNHFNCMLISLPRSNALCDQGDMVIATIDTLWRPTIEVTCIHALFSHPWCNAST